MRPFAGASLSSSSASAAPSVSPIAARVLEQQRDHSGDLRRGRAGAVHARRRRAARGRAQNAAAGGILLGRREHVGFLDAVARGPARRVAADFAACAVLYAPTLMRELDVHSSPSVPVACRHRRGWKCDCRRRAPPGRPERVALDPRIVRALPRVADIRAAAIAPRPGRERRRRRPLRASVGLSVTRIMCDWLAAYGLPSIRLVVPTATMTPSTAA